MLTPISTKIEEFEKIGEGRVRFVATRQEVRDFISTALEQRDEEWRELLESEKKAVTRDEYGAPEDMGMCFNVELNQALNDIITKSKEI
ncbi:MAG TPA: hypothetical protein PKV66_00125 [Candidatus Pelethenecus sp.]|nr:hypothetical protein [Candidatus Pelethenecus sp.]